MKGEKEKLEKVIKYAEKELIDWASFILECRKRLKNIDRKVVKKRK